MKLLSCMRIRRNWTRALIIPAFIVYLGTPIQTQQPQGALSLEEVTTLLQAGSPMATIQGAMTEFGVDFRLTTTIVSNLRSAGATDEFLQAFRALPGLVTFTSEPPRASVFIDGEDRGQTPLEVRLPPGSVLVTVTLHGYSSTDTVTVAPGVAETMHIVLDAAPDIIAANLEVLSEPPGAAVFVDGQQRGETPVSLSLDPGEHELAITLENYLENRQLVELEAGNTETLSVTLTSVVATQPVVERGGGGGSRLPLILALVGGGAAAAVAGTTLAGGNQPPSIGGINQSPNGIGLTEVTQFTFTASGARDQDGDALTISWNFGDGRSDSGQTVTHIYSRTGIFTVAASVSDGKDSSSTSTSVTVTSISGTWVGTGPVEQRDGGTIDAEQTLVLTQSGSSFAGEFTFRWLDRSSVLRGQVSGTLSSPREIRGTAKLDCCSNTRLNGSLSSDGNTLVGSNMLYEVSTLSRQ